jgi:hypothetical protein
MSRPIGIDDELWFGKHEGRTVGEVLEDDPVYIQWLADNMDYMDFDAEVLELLGKHR